MARPVWVRVLLQVGLAIVLFLVVPYTFLPQAKLELAVYRAVPGPKWITILAMVGATAQTWVVVAVPAAVVSWLVVRRPWDAVYSCALLYSSVKLIFRVGHADWTSWLFEGCNILAMALSCWAVASIAHWSDRTGKRQKPAPWQR